MRSPPNRRSFDVFLLPIPSWSCSSRNLRLRRDLLGRVRAGPPAGRGSGRAARRRQRQPAVAHHRQGALLACTHAGDRRRHLGPRRGGADGSPPAFPQSPRPVAGGRLRLSAARRRGGGRHAAGGGGAGHRGRGAGEGAGEAHIRGGEVVGATGVAGGAGAAEPLHHVGGQSRAGGGARRGDRIPAGTALRRRTLQPTLPDGGESPLLARFGERRGSRPA